MRTYDVIVRYGGDEFVCLISGQDASGARRRFEAITADIARTCRGATIAVGCIDAGAQATVGELIAQADLAMMATRQLPR